MAVINSLIFSAWKLHDCVFLFGGMAVINSLIFSAWKLHDCVVSNHVTKLHGYIVIIFFHFEW